MMKLWIVFYVLGHASVVIGPLGGSIDTCNARAALAQVSTREAATPDTGIAPADITVQCVQSIAQLGSAPAQQKPTSEG
jgi:hypothetical protein